MAVGWADNLKIKPIKTMKKLIMVLSLMSFGAMAQKIDVNKQFALAGQQYMRMLADHPDTSKTIHSAKPDGTYRDLPSSWWCSGFFFLFVDEELTFSIIQNVFLS